MSDIIKQLRRWAHTEGCGCTRCTAANEIEQLTSDLDAVRVLSAETAIKLANAIRSRETLTAENSRLREKIAKFIHEENVDGEGQDPHGIYDPRPGHD